jgi:outer membrane protein assembly factor BamB
MRKIVCWLVTVTVMMTTGVAVYAGEPAGPHLSHSVYFKLKNPTNEARRSLVDACHKYLSGHPGTVWFAAGTVAEEFDRPVNVRDYDVALYIVFADREAHDRYQSAPRHERFIEEQRDNWAAVRVFDSWVRSGHGGSEAAGTFDWPQWRGSDRSGVSRETGLLRSWPEGGPRRVWLYENAGEGYSAPAIVGGRMFTMGTRDDQECLLILDAMTGEELGVTPVGVVFRESRGNGPRATPTVDGDRVYALGGRGDLVCVRIEDGSVLWRTSMIELGGSVPTWGYTESVLVDGDLVVCTPGGSRGTVVALDKRTGEVRWRSSAFTEPAHYSSMVVAELNGARQYVQRTEQHVVGIAAADGALLWQTSFPGRVAVIPTPIHRDGHVYVSAGYGAGCKLVRIGPDHEVEEIYQNTVMRNHHGGVILVGDHVYGHSDGSGWVCQDFLSGEEVWSERDALGKGAIAYADGRFYCLDEATGTVALIEASPDGWREHGRFTLEPQTRIRTPQGRVWTHPVISNGRLYLRDQDIIYCFDIRAR